MESSVRDQNKKMCALCGTTNDLLLCAGCKIVSYCGKQHQREHWRLGHRAVCKKEKDQVQQTQELNTQPSGLSKSSVLGGLLNTVASQKVPAGVQADSATNQLGAAAANSSADLMVDLQSYLPAIEAFQNSNNPKQLFDVYQPSRMTSNVSPSTSASTSASAAVGSKSGSTVLLDGTNLKSVSEYVLQKLHLYGICILDNFLGETKGDKVLEEVLHLDQTNQLKQGLLLDLSGREPTSTSPSEPGEVIRGDKVTWIANRDPNHPHICNMVKKIDAIIGECDNKIDKYHINGRTKAMVACYPGNGTFYKQHCDNPNNEDGRCVTCIYYLNKNWDAERDGGLLRIYPQSMTNVKADIIPLFDRLVFFYSDHRNPHEVRPSFRTRYAITVWYYDGRERLVAKLKYQRNVAALQAKEAAEAAAKSAGGAGASNQSN